MSDPSIMEGIARMVPQGARVLDLGCGDGALMAYLQAERGCQGYGVEIDDAALQAGLHLGIIDLDAVAAAATPALQIGHQCAIAAAQVEHACTLRHQAWLQRLRRRDR